MYPDGSSQFQYDAIPETRMKKSQYDKSNGGATSLSWIRDAFCTPHLERSVLGTGGGGVKTKTGSK